MNRKRYLHYFRREIIENKLFKQLYRRKNESPILFAKKSVPTNEDAGGVIADYIISGRPFSLIRPGSGEFNEYVMWEEEQLFGRKIYNRKTDPNRASLKKLIGDGFDNYQKQIRSFFGEVDVFAFFPGAILEEYLVEEYAKSAQTISFLGLTPLFKKKPWTDALKGKKVLVISPFADKLLEQYQKRDQLFNGEWKWPEMELKVLKSVWYFGPNERFSSWNDALMYLYNSAMKIDFDVALLSCGAFAVSLAPMLKRAGKQAIQYGGELQILFGIRGARWDNNSALIPYFNDSWIRLSKQDTGITENDAKNMDDGVCYW